MSRILVITSGKGGVGKTTTAASFAAALAVRGYKTVVVDFDVGLRNLDLAMGCDKRVVFDLVDVIDGEANLSQAIIKDSRIDNLYILASSQTHDKSALDKEKVGKLLKDLVAQFDFVICDSPAGIEKGARLALHFADDAIIVVNPETASIRDADRILGVLESRAHPPITHFLLTRYNAQKAAEGIMVSASKVKETLDIPFLGVIPEHEDVTRAGNSGSPVTLDGNGPAYEAYTDAVARYLGEDKPYRFIDSERKGFAGFLAFFKTSK